MEKKISVVPTLDLCTVPQLLPAYTLTDKTVLVVDVFRATSTIITALAHGVKQVVVADTLEKCLTLGGLGFVTVGERNGEKLEACRLSNSPQEFTQKRWAGEQIALTSTNGTQAILAARSAAAVLVGAFLNLGALLNYFRRSYGSVLVLCAGRKGHLSPEDLLFAGALAAALQDIYTLSDDIQVVKDLYGVAQEDIKGFLSKYTQIQRLQTLGLDKDIDFCLQQSLYDVIPCYTRGYIQIQR